MNTKNSTGYICALLASLSSGAIGILSVQAIYHGMSALSIAFYRCLFAFIIMSIYLLSSKKFIDWIYYLKSKWWKVGLCAFFGLGMLYTSETSAYRYLNISVVTFLALGVSVIVTFVLSAIIHNHKTSFFEILSCILAIIGLMCFFGINNPRINSIGAILAIFSGIGYGTFLTLSRTLVIGHGLQVVNSLTLFGMIFLLPGILLSKHALITLHAFPFVLCLAIIPTICGFYLTTKALTILKSSTVQLIELNEPIFATILAYIVLHQIVNLNQIIGGAIILSSILINVIGHNFKSYHA